MTYGCARALDFSENGDSSESGSADPARTCARGNGPDLLETAGRGYPRMKSSMNTQPLAYALVLLLAAPAAADVVHLTNGRRIEGRVLESRQGQVHIEVQGGRIVLPADSIEHIEDCATPEEEYAQRARATNMGDPDAVARLASWASARGLGDQAAHLRALSLGLDLERRVSRAQVGGRVMDWMDTYRWARDRGLSVEVQRWVVEQATAIDPDHPSVRAAAAELERERTPDLGGAAPEKKPAAPPAAPPQEDARVANLERELQQRDSEAKALEERIAQLERDRRMTRRRRNPNPVVLPRDIMGPPAAEGATVTTPKR